jgi:hypothetical protein
MSSAVKSIGGVGHIPDATKRPAIAGRPVMPSTALCRPSMPSLHLLPLRASCRAFGLFL